MDDFLNKLKARTENLKLFDQDGLDEDALWANIEEEIGEKVEKRKTRGFLFFLPFLLLGIFFVVGIGMYFYKNTEERIQKENRNSTQQHSIVEMQMQHKQSTLIDSNDEKKGRLETQGKDLSITKTTEEAVTKSSTVFQQSNDKSRIRGGVVESTNIVALKKGTEESIFKSSSKLKESDYKIINYDDRAVHENTKIVPLKKQSNNSIVEKQNISSKEENGSSLIPDAIKLSKPIVLLPSMISILDNNHIVESLDLPKSYIVPSKKGKKISLGFFTGTHLLHSNFKTTNPGSQERKQLLNAGFKSKLAYSLSAEFILNLTNKLSLTSGIEYIYSIEQFNYETSWETTFQSLQKPNTIINRVSERKVIHHNRHALFSIPILVGTQIQKGRFELGLNLGVGLNFTQLQKGKSLGNNLEVVEFSSADNNLSPRPNFFLSYHFCPYLNYQLDKNLKVQLRPNFRYQTYGATDFYKEMEFSSVLTGLQVGIIMDILN